MLHTKQHNVLNQIQGNCDRIHLVGWCTTEQHIWVFDLFRSCLLYYFRLYLREIHRYQYKLINSVISESYILRQVNYEWSHYICFSSLNPKECVKNFKMRYWKSVENIHFMVFLILVLSFFYKTSNMEISSFFGVISCFQNFQKYVS